MSNEIPIRCIPLGKCPHCGKDALSAVRYDFRGRVELYIECSYCEIEPRIDGITRGHSLGITYFKDPKKGRSHAA
jgi:hypothetical protein